MMFLLLMGCEEKAPWTPNLPDEPKDTTTVTPGTNPFKAPLYWSVYEYCYTVDAGIPELEWERNINWVEENLLPYGYDMICIDG